MQHLENNYQKRAAKARARFLTYDQEDIIRRNRLEADEDWLYARLLDLDLRLDRASAELEAKTPEGWGPCPGVEAPMVLLDILCDSRPGRRALGYWKSTLDFGFHVHRSLMENGPASPLERRFNDDPELLRRRALALGGRAAVGTDIGGADQAYVLPFFQDLNLLVQFWEGDEEFQPRLRFLWDGGAGDYLKYETMYYALDLVRRRLGGEADDRIFASD